MTTNAEVFASNVGKCQNRKMVGWTFMDYFGTIRRMENINHYSMTMVSPDALLSMSTFEKKRIDRNILVKNSDSFLTDQYGCCFSLYVVV